MEGRGRGAALKALLKKHQERRDVGTPGEVEEESKVPPGPRGRAAALKKLMEMRQQQKVGTVVEKTEEKPTTTTTTTTASTVGPMTRKFQELEISEPAEPTYFRGESGKQIKASANYIRLDVEADRGVYEYEVKFVPDVDAKYNRVKLVNQHLGELNTARVYDGGSCLYLPRQEFQAKEEFQGVLPNTDEEVKTIFIYKRKKRLSECLHLYNVLFKRIMHVLMYTQMGQDYYSPKDKCEIPQYKLEVFPGFAVTVDEVEGGLMLCLNTSHRVIRTQKVLELMYDLRASDPQNFKQNVISAVVGSCVSTQYNNQTYIIDDIDWNMTPEHKFETKSGEISFKDYYRIHYNINIEQLDQPMLITRKTVNVQGTKQDRMICLVPELCNLTGLTDAMRSDFKLQKELAQYTQVTPNQRMLSIRKYIENVKNSELAQKILGGWGLKLHDGTTGINARVLPAEKVFFANNQHYIGIDWNTAISNNKITGPIDLVDWFVCHTKRDERLAHTFVELALKLANGMGCIVKPPKMCVLNDDRTDSYVKACHEHLRTNTQMGVFICPTRREDRYFAIKKICSVDFPTGSQVILAKSLNNQRSVRNIVQKIMMQINCKLGGTLWHVPIPILSIMVCGIDVYHAKNQRSVCGFVATINESLTRYFNEGIFQERELGDFFKISFKKSLAAYKQARGEFPSKIIIYRDGVGNGQLQYVREYELKQFQSVLQELNITASITFLVVQKRINTRIFQVSESGREYSNPQMGTVVDCDVTKREFKDFYLIPQTVKQGTVNPTHYIVIHDDANMKADHLQRLSYKLCHLYYNWSGTIRVPAPCQYAHRLAAFVGQVLKKVPDASLNLRLHYL